MQLSVSTRCEHLPAVYLSFLPVWAALGAYWAWAVLVRHRESAFELHRLLLWVPAVEVAHAFLSVFYYWLCPWSSTLEKVVAAAWVVVAILKEPVMLVCLLMVAKGWCITRPHLSSRETVVSTVIVALLYASVIVQMSDAEFVRVGALGFSIAVSCITPN